MTYPAGRRSRDRPGPYGARRDYGLDVRWGEEFLHVVSLHPELLDELLRIIRDSWDWGHRAPRGAPNPVWLDPRIAGHGD